MRIGLRGFVLVTLVVGISSCSGGENDSRSGAAEGGIGGTEAPDGGTGVTTNSAGSASAGGSQAGSSTAAGGGGGASVIAVGGTRPVSSTGSSSSSGGWPADAGARPVLSDCGLPVPGAGGIAKPSGTPGNLRVLNWAGFKAATSYTFDDANSSQITNYAALNGLGVPLTFFLWTDRSTAADPAWARAVLDGHELGNHTQSHLQTGTAADVDGATTFIQTHFGVKAWTMASPYGNASYVPLAQTRFLANRGVGSGWSLPNGSNDPFNLPCYIPAQGALASAFNAVTDSSRSAGAWQIVLVHGFIGGTDGAYQPVAIGEFTSSVYHNKAWGDVWIDSMVQVAAYWRAQKMFSSVTPTTAGTDRTWTWTLPANFPPGKCLRVNVDGGSLKQGGGTLAWNDHGFYEISLDKGAVTLSSSTDTTNTGGSGGAGAGTGGSPAAGGSNAGTSGSVLTGGSNAGTGGFSSVGGSKADTGGSVSVVNAGTGGTPSDGGSNAGTGGTPSDGGANANTGGTPSDGGANAGTGGTPSDGGANAGTGGILSDGGSSADTGGTLSTGGFSADTGGTLSTGGFSADTGGMLSTGGFSADTGGTLSTGGSIAGTGGMPSDGGSNAGTGGTPSDGGANANAGGANADTGGSPSTGGNGSASDTSATGVIEMIVPFAEDGQDQGYDIDHSSAPLDLSGATVTVRIYAPDAFNGQVTLWFSSSGGGVSTEVSTAFTDLNAGYFEIQATVPGADVTFDPSQIDGVHFEVQSISSGPWQSPATIVYLDSVVSSIGNLNDTFDTSPDASFFVPSIWQTVTDSSFTWLANSP